MHINACDLPPSKAFCFIIEYIPYLEELPGYYICKNETGLELLLSKSQLFSQCKPDQGSKKINSLLKLLIRWFCWFEKYKSTNNYWFIKPSTNSTNQQKIFVENFDEFCLNLLVRLQFTLKFSLNLLKISTNQRKFSTNSTNHQNQRLVDSLIWFRWFCWFVEFVEKINKNKKQRGILESSSTKIKNNKSF